jgi:hypothetical protein
MNFNYFIRYLLRHKYLLRVVTIHSKKNIILYSLFSLCLLVWNQSCKETPAKSPSHPQVNKSPLSIEESTKQEFLISNTSSRQEFLEWPKFSNLDAAIKNLENSNPTFFQQPIEDISQLFLDIKKSIPKSLKTNGILARVKVSETLARKLHEIYNVEDTDLIESEQTKIDLIESHANLLFQINKTREKEAQRIIKPI